MKCAALVGVLIGRLSWGSRRSNRNSICENECRNLMRQLNLGEFYELVEASSPDVESSALEWEEKGYSAKDHSRISSLGRNHEECDTG